MAVDYGAGTSSAIAQQYSDLRAALASKGEAENRRKAEDIRRKGLFGTGITQENLQGLASTGLGIAEFGQKRMAGQMDRATKSFERRRKESLGRIDELRRFGDPESIAEIKAIQAGMSENRSTYENLLGDYEGKGLFGTGFGSEGVGYKSTGDPSSYTKSLLESKKKREEEGERQAGILSDESRRQQGQISDYGSAPAKAEAPIYGGDLEGDIDQKYWAGGPEEDQPLGLAEKALADAAPAEAAPAPVPLTAHEKEGEERFFKGMSFKQRDKAMEGLKTYGGEYDDAFKQASGEKQKWFIWKGKPFSTALK